MVKKKATKSLTETQKAFIVGRQYQAKIDAMAIGQAVKSGKIKIKK